MFEIPKLSANDARDLGGGDPGVRSPGDNLSFWSFWNAISRILKRVLEESYNHKRPILKLLNVVT